jgi:hypothetical protein
VQLVSRILVVAVLGVAAYALPLRAAQDVDPELRQALQQREDAFAKRDLVTWAKYTADDYLLTTETGTVRTKAEQLASMRSNPASPLKRGARREEAVHRYGNTVILWMVVDSQSGPRREMQVWVKDADVWKVAGVQVTQSRRN